MNKFNFNGFKKILLATLSLSVGLIAEGRAAINPGAYSGSSGELFLSVWDQTQQQSYSLDLGESVDALLGNPHAGATWSLGAKFASFTSYFNNGDVLTYNIAGSNGYPGLVNSATGNYNTNYGFIASHLLGASLNPQPVANTQLTQIYNAFESHIGFLNNSELNQNLGSSGTNYAANLSEVTTSPAANSYFNYTWGLNEAKIPWLASATTSNAASQSLDMYFLHGNPSASSASIDQVGAGMDFTLNAAAGTLTWAPIPTPTSVPFPNITYVVLGAGLSIIGFQRSKRYDRRV